MSLQKGTLGNAIRNARTQKNMTQEELAENIGISIIHLKHIEGGNRQPSIEVLFRLMEVLHFSVDHLIFAPQPGTSLLLRNASLLLTQCNEKELQLIIDLTQSILKHHHDPE